MPRENDSGAVRCDHSDIYSCGRFDNIVAVHLRETTDHEIHFEISSGPSRSHRTRHEKGAILHVILRLTHCITVSRHAENVFQSLKKEIERRIEVIPRIQYEPQLISDSRYILTPGGQAPPHYYRLKAVDDVKTLGKSRCKETM